MYVHYHHQMSEKPQYKIETIPHMRRLVFDVGIMGRTRHSIHGLIEVDVTSAREYFRAHEQATSETLSFTAFVITCLGKALELNEHLYAHRDWRNHLVIFEDVNITAMIETEISGKKAPLPHVFNGIDNKTFRQVHEELRAAQVAPRESDEGKFLHFLTYLPGILRRAIFKLLIKFPILLPEYSSSVMVTAVGMFGKGGGWGIPRSNYTLTVTVGGITDLTLSIDHDIVDGAPALWLCY